jgi:CRISPR-associated endonuclease/helicase Cas3
LVPFWAKYEGKSGDWHPLIAHALETGAVSRVLIQRSLSPHFLCFVARAVELDVAATLNLVAALAAVHDIGKINPGFQHQIGWFREQQQAQGFSAPARISSTPHGLITAYCLQRRLEQTHGMQSGVAMPLASVVGGHHGVLPPPEKWRNLSAAELGGPSWDNARTSMLAMILEGLGTSLPCPSRLPHAAALTIAGLISVADWIASNSDLFPYSANTERAIELPDPRTYFRDSLRRAETAVKRLGWHTRSSIQLPDSFAGLFPWIKTPNSLQQQAFTAARGSAGPTLLLIEAAMGEGKTEAALSASEVWTAALGYRGAYFALPTQATSNQMFSRVRAFLEDRAHGDRLFLQLLHGHASLSAEFEELRALGTDTFGTRGVGESQGESVVASTWFTYRKRGLLAAFGVGTVDQVLMAALSGKHVFVRLFGLAGKTVIIDEVHAYDTYMSTLLERVLEWLSALGSSVVLLSATLPASRRDDLVNAYAKGLQLESPTLPTTIEYPRIITVSRDGVKSATFASSSPHASKRIGLAWTQMEGLAELLQGQLAGGGCAVAICNTRKDAQRLFQELEPHFPGMASDGYPELDLLHSHFLFADRDAAEKRSLTRFGKPGKASRRPTRAVLIATQIVEQSLDLDFDVMISAVAPIDLLFQRMGRLHRHLRDRPALLSKPVMALIGVPLDEDGLPKFPRGHLSVYELHLLFRTWLALRERESVAIPEDIDPLLNAVYRDEPEPASLSEAGQSIWRESRRKLRAHRTAEHTAAQDRYLRSPSSKMAVWELTEAGYAADDPEQSQFLAVTRLTEPSVRVVFLSRHPTESNHAQIPGVDGKRLTNPR